MTEYRRAYVPGGSWFFTVNLAERKNNRLLVEKVDLLRSAFEYTQQRHPFRMDAVVILPDHLHCIWTLPQEDADFSTRWNLLKGYFSRHIATGERISASRKSRREEDYGSAGSGSIFYVTKMILTGMPIIFIGIPLNLTGQKGSVIGLIPAFIDISNEAPIRALGKS